MSAPRDDSVYLDHIRDAIARITSYVEGISEATFLETPLIQDPVIRQIQIIGEAARRLSRELQQQTPAIPWKDVMGMRDKLVHDYMGGDLAAVWDTATNDVPALSEQLKHRSGSSGGSPHSTR